MAVRVDVQQGCVWIGRTRLEGQWATFYALLGLTRTDERDADAFVTAEMVSHVGAWRHKTLRSVRAEVARHLDKLAQMGMDRLVEFHGRTKAWRLAVRPKDVLLLPDRPAVHAWVRAESAKDVDTDDWLKDLSALVHAAVALFHDGDAEKAIDALDAVFRTPPSRATRTRSSKNRTASGRVACQRPEDRAKGVAEPALEAWAALVRGRAAHQEDDENDERLHHLIKQWTPRLDAPAKAVVARLRATMALRYRFEDPSHGLAALVKLATDLEHRGDIGSLATVVNVMGVLATRAGDFRAAAGHHLRAAALFGLSGDYYLLQAALFNLANVRRKAARRDNLVADATTFALLDLCLVVCASFGVGNDSAQAETAGADWAHEAGDKPLAERYLERAEQLLDRIASTYDQAYFRKVRGRIRLDVPTRAGEARHDLRTAIRLFRKVGDEASAAECLALLKQCTGH